MHASFLKYLESGPPPDYHEMFVSLAKIAADSRTLLSSFANEGKIPQTKIPQLPAQLDGSPDSFTLAKASEVVGPIFDSLKTALPKSKKKEIAAFEERKQLVVRGIARYKEDKERFDTRLAAAIAAAVIALRRMPGRLNPVIQSAMNGVKVGCYSALRFFLC
jgi:TATA-binding protein-associated factor